MQQHPPKTRHGHRQAGTGRPAPADAHLPIPTLDVLLTLHRFGGTGRSGPTVQVDTIYIHNCRQLTIPKGTFRNVRIRGVATKIGAQLTV